VPEKAPALKVHCFLIDAYIWVVILVQSFLSKVQGNVISELNKDLFFIADLLYFGFTE
jgi:hypothetical protein